jgi:hypothetical protein
VKYFINEVINSCVVVDSKRDLVYEAIFSSATTRRRIVRKMGMKSVLRRGVEMSWDFKSV